MSTSTSRAYSEINDLLFSEATAVSSSSSRAWPIPTARSLDAAAGTGFSRPGGTRQDTQVPDRRRQHHKPGLRRPPRRDERSHFADFNVKKGRLRRSSADRRVILNASQSGTNDLHAGLEVRAIRRLPPSPSRASSIVTHTDRPSTRSPGTPASDPEGQPLGYVSGRYFSSTKTRPSATIAGLHHVRSPIRRSDATSSRTPASRPRPFSDQLRLFARYPRIPTTSSNSLYERGDGGYNTGRHNIHHQV